MNRKYILIIIALPIFLFIFLIYKDKVNIDISTDQKPTKKIDYTVKKDDSLKVQSSTKGNYPIASSSIDMASVGPERRKGEIGNYTKQLSALQNDINEFDLANIKDRSLEYYQYKRALRKFESGKHRLLGPKFNKQLIEFTEQLLPFVKDDFLTSEYSALILAKLDISEQLKNELRNSPTSPLRVKAYLGDSKAFEKIVDKFLMDEKRRSKRSIGERMIYSGIDQYPTLFAKALESEEAVCFDHFENQSSDLLNLLLAYRHYNPDENLFKGEMNKHYFTTEEEFADEKHQEFIRKIEEYFRDTHSIVFKAKAKFLIKGERPKGLIFRK